MVGERTLALLAGRRMDRIPVWLWGFSPGFAARNVGYVLADIETDVAKRFRSQILTAEMYGSDNIPTSGFGGVGRDAWAFGGRVKQPAGEFEQTPTIVDYPVKSEADALQLTLPEDVTQGGPFPLEMQFSRLLVKNGLPAGIVCPCPVDVVRSLCGIDTLCRWLIKKPHLVHRLLRLANDYHLKVIRYWVDTFPPADILVFCPAPTTSNQVMSPRHFKEFTLPYQKELHEKILEMGIRHIIVHVCGDQEMNLPFWAQIPMGDPGILSFGHEVSLAKAIEYFGDAAIIAGNIAPAVIQTGSPSQVYELCRQAIAAGKNARRGFILMPGCALPPAAPPYNLFVMKKAADDFGRY